MSNTLALKRGSGTTTPTAAAYVGQKGEVLVDTDSNCLRVQDGTTAGGHQICPTAAGAAFTLDPVSTGTSHTVSFSSAQTCTYWTSATAGAKTTHIPAAAAGNAGYLWIIKTTLNNGDSHFIIPPSGTVDGQGTITFSDFRVSLSMISDGVNNWMLT